MMSLMAMAMNPVAVTYGFFKGFKKGMKALKEQREGIDIDPENIYDFWGEKWEDIVQTMEFCKK